MTQCQVNQTELVEEKVVEVPKLRKYLPVLILLPLAGLAELASLFFIQTILPLFAIEYQIPVSQVSIIMSAETAALAFGLLFTGSLSDKYGRKRVIVVSLILGAILTFVCPFVKSWALLVALRALAGLSLSGIAAAATAYISEEVAPAVAGIITGYFVFGNSLGSMSGRVIASQLMDRIPLAFIFVIFGVSLAVVALLIWKFLPDSRNFNSQSKVNVLNLVKGGAGHFKNKNVALLFFVGFVIFGSFTSIFNYLAFHLNSAPFNLAYSTTGLIPISFALTFFTAPLAGRFAVKFGSMNVLAILLLVMIISLGWTNFTSNTIIFIAGIILFSVCFYACHGLGLAWVSRNAKFAKGQATAFYLVFYYLGGAVVGYITGHIYHMFNWQGLSSILVVLMVISIAITRILNPIEKAQRKNN